MSIYWVIIIGLSAFWVGYATCGTLTFNDIWNIAQEAKERELRIKSMLEEIRNIEQENTK